MYKYNLDPITNLDVLVTLRMRIQDLWEKRRNSIRVRGIHAANDWNDMITRAVATLRIFRASMIE